jgi:glycosyltransferase involved in cell wall biosynthesis
MSSLKKTLRTDAPVKLSVIIPCYNAASTIGHQLEALTRQRWCEPWEVIVSNNGSTDALVDVVRQFEHRLPRLRVIDASARAGSSYARNVAARQACGDALAFCDADDEVGVDWLPAMGDALEMSSFVASRLDIEKLNPPWIQTIYGPHPQRAGLQQVWYAPYFVHGAGGTLGVQRLVHEAVGGFDESLLRVMDADYSFRIQRLGYQLTFVKNAVVHCRLRQSTLSACRQGRLWSRYNVLLYKRYRPAGTREYGRWLYYFGAWLKLTMQMAKIRNHTQLARWLWLVSWQVGRLEGSLKFGVPPV